MFATRLPYFSPPGAPGGEIQVSARFPSFLPRSCRNKTAATKRIDASRCKFVLFFTAGHPAAAFASPRLASPRCSSLLTRDFYFNNDGLSWISRLLYFILYKSYTSKPREILYYRENIGMVPLLFRFVVGIINMYENVLIM